MQSFLTKYGILDGADRYSTFENGQLESICLDREYKLNTSVGILIPRYTDFTGRRKNTKCLSFYPSGEIKSIDLQEQTSINTPIGVIDAELITFYENGAIKRIFPLNGAINGMWSEEDESELVKNICIQLLNTTFNLKINSIYFYPEGSVKSISLFPGKTTSVPTPFGIIEIRNGFSLSKDGHLLTLEPASPYKIRTFLGILHAYDSSAIGIHADKNSLVFDPSDNKISELVTSTDIIKITDTSGKIHYFSPTFVESSINDEGTELIPLRIKFNSETVTFSGQDEQKINISDIIDIKLSSIPLVTSECTDCASCGKCGII